MSRAPGFPKLHDGDYAVVCAERDTGIVLSLDGRRAIDDAQRYRVFASLDAAVSYAADLVAANPGWEAVVFDAGGVVVDTCHAEDSNQQRRERRASPRWWKRWLGREK
jgi:hypothetical protein